MTKNTHANIKQDNELTYKRTKLVTMSGRTKHSTPTAVNRKAGPLLVGASQVAAVHTYLAFSAFATALLLGCAFHYKKIVKNGIAGYPEEWFPSVSATSVGFVSSRRTLFRLRASL